MKDTASKDFILYPWTWHCFICSQVVAWRKGLQLQGLWGKIVTISTGTPITTFTIGCSVVLLKGVRKSRIFKDWLDPLMCARDFQLQPKRLCVKLHFDLLKLAL